MMNVFSENEKNNNNHTEKVPDTGIGVMTMRDYVCVPVLLTR